MPQNAIIKADGTGDYTTVSAWFAAESASNYGAPTRAYINGTVNAGANIVFNTAGGNWPNGFELRAVSGQEYNGTNHTTCARINHTGSLLEFADTDADVQDLALGVTGGFNVEVIKSSNTVTTTQRRNITLKRLYVESPPSYHGSTYTIEFNAVSYASGAGSQYNLDFEDIVIYTRASNRGIYIAGRTDNGTFTGSVRRVTVLPTNSGTNVTNGFWLGTGNDSVVTVDKILSLDSQTISTVVDYSYGGLGGTQTNISTNDETGTVTGVTTTTELENYAAGDYRLKATGSGNGAFPQEAPSADITTEISYDIGTIDYAISATVPSQDISTDINYDIGEIDYSASALQQVPQFDADLSYDIGEIVYSVSVSVESPNSTAELSYDIGEIAYQAAAEISAPVFTADLSFDIGEISFSVTANTGEPIRQSTFSFDIGAVSFDASTSVSVPQYQAELSFDIGEISYSVFATSEQPINQSALSYDIGEISYLVYTESSEPVPSDIDALISYDIGGIGYLITALNGNVLVYASEDAGITFAEPENGIAFTEPSSGIQF